MVHEGTLKKCLFIAPIDSEGSDIRRHSDNVLKFIIKPVASECGYETIRADEISEPGIITHQIIGHILKDDLVIADLTYGNPNVFYELALRHAIRKPCIQIAQSQVPLPFDVAPVRTILFTEKDMSSVDLCKQKLAKQIKATEHSTASFESPISVGIDILQLSTSSNLHEKSNAEILSMLQDLRGEFVKNLREQSERISELQSLLEVNAQKDLKDQLSSTGSQSGKKDWDNFISQIDLFDRTNLVESLDNLLLFGTPAFTTLHAPYTTSLSYATLVPPIDFKISEGTNGSYKIAFLNHEIIVNKEDLKTFRDYVEKHGILTLTGVAGIGKY